MIDLTIFHLIHDPELLRFVRLTARALKLLACRLTLLHSEKIFVLSQHGTLPVLEASNESSLIQEILQTSKLTINSRKTTSLLHPDLQFSAGMPLQLSKEYTAVLMIYDGKTKELTKKDRLILEEMCQLIEEYCERKHRIIFDIEDASANFVIGMISGLKVPLIRLLKEKEQILGLRKEIIKETTSYTTRKLLLQRFFNHYDEFEYYVQDLQDCIQASLHIGKSILPYQTTTPLVAQVGIDPNYDDKNGLQVYSFTEIVDAAKCTMTDTKKKQRRITWNYFENNLIAIPAASFSLLMAMTRYIVNKQLHYYQTVQIIFTVQEQKSATLDPISSPANKVSSSILSPRRTPSDHYLSVAINLKFPFPSSIEEEPGTKEQNQICLLFLHELIHILHGRLVYDENHPNELNCQLLVPCILKESGKMLTMSSDGTIELPFIAVEGEPGSVRRLNSLHCISLDEKDIYERSYTLRVNRKKLTSANSMSNLSPPTTFIEATTTNNNHHHHHHCRSMKGKISPHSFQSLFGKRQKANAVHVYHENQQQRQQQQCQLQNEENQQSPVITRTKRIHSQQQSSSSSLVSSCSSCSSSSPHYSIVSTLKGFFHNIYQHLINNNSAK